VNAYEAESRRLARFTTQGPSQVPAGVPTGAPHREFPFTLDLRVG